MICCEVDSAEAMTLLDSTMCPRSHALWDLLWDISYFINRDFHIQCSLGHCDANDVADGLAKIGLHSEASFQMLYTPPIKFERLLLLVQGEGD